MKSRNFKKKIALPHNLGTFVFSECKIFSIKPVRLSFSTTITMKVETRVNCFFLQHCTSKSCILIDHINIVLKYTYNLLHESPLCILVAQGRTDIAMSNEEMGFGDVSKQLESNTKLKPYLAPEAQKHCLCAHRSDCLGFCKNENVLSSC